MDIQNLITKIEAFSQATGTNPDAVCRAATGNPRLYARLIRRLDQTRADADRIAAYMAKHSPKSPTKSEAP